MTERGDEAPEVPATDAYEAQYMEGGQGIFRSKMRMPGWFFALIGVATALSVGGGVLAAVQSGALAAWLAPVFSLTLLTLTTLLFSHLRVVLTSTHLHVQFGLVGPKIALEQIERCTAEEYRALDYGGWGVRYGGNSTWAYSVPGGEGRAIRVEYRTPDGKKKVAVVTSPEADVLAAAINRARAAKGGGVRIEAGGASDARADEVETSGGEAAKGEAKRG